MTNNCRVAPNFRYLTSGTATGNSPGNTGWPCVKTFIAIGIFGKTVGFTAWLWSSCKQAPGIERCKIRKSSTGSRLMDFRKFDSFVNHKASRGKLTTWNHLPNIMNVFIEINNTTWCCYDIRFFFFHVKTKEHLVTSSPVRRPMALELQRGQCLGLAEKQPTTPWELPPKCWSDARCDAEDETFATWSYSSTYGTFETSSWSYYQTIVSWKATSDAQRSDSTKSGDHVFCFFWMHHNDQHHGFWKNLRIHNQVPPTLTNITESLKLEGIGILEKNLSWWAFLAVWFFIELDERPDGESH